MNEPVRCTNCGKEIRGDPKRCCVYDRCIPAQNAEINRVLGEKVYVLLAQGKQVYADQGRPLCWGCWSTNGGVCSHCELDKALES